MRERIRLGRLLQRLCRFTTYTAHTSDSVALLIVCTYVVRIQRLGRSLPATWSLASFALPSPHRSMCFECIVSRGVVVEPGVCPHVPRRVLARVGHCEGLGPQRFMPVCRTCVAAVFGLAVLPPIYVQQDRPNHRCASPECVVLALQRTAPTTQFLARRASTSPAKSSSAWTPTSTLTWPTSAWAGAPQAATPQSTAAPSQPQ